MRSDPFSLPLKTPVKAKPPGRGWKSGVLVGRSFESTPHYDVMLEDRTIVTGLTSDYVRVVYEPA